MYCSDPNLFSSTNKNVLNQLAVNASELQPLSFGVTLMEYNAKCPTIFKNAQNSDLCNDFFCNCFFHLNLKGYCPLL